MSILKHILCLAAAIVASLSADAKLLMPSLDSVFVYDAAQPRLMTNSDHYASQYAFSCRGRYIFTCNSGELAVWDRPSRRVIQTFDLHDRDGNRYIITDMAPDIRNEKWIALRFNVNTQSAPDTYPALLLDWTTGKIVAYLDADKWDNLFGHYKKVMPSNELVLYSRRFSTYDINKVGSSEIPHFGFRAAVIGSARSDSRDSLLFCAGMHELLWDLRHARLANVPGYKMHVLKKDNTLDHKDLDRGLPKPKEWNMANDRQLVNHNHFMGTFTSPTSYAMGGATHELNIFDFDDCSRRHEKLPGDAGPVFDFKDYGGWRVIACWDGIYGGRVGGPYKRYKAFDRDKQTGSSIFRNCAIVISEPYGDGRFMASMIGGALAGGGDGYRCIVEGKFGVDTLTRAFDMPDTSTETLEDIKIIDNGRAALCSSGYSIWELELSDPGKIKLNRAFNVPGSRFESVYACEALPDGRYVAGTSTGRILVTDPATATPDPTDTKRNYSVTAKLHSSRWTTADSPRSARMSSMSLSSNGTKLFTADYKGKVVIWDAATLTPIVTLHNLYPFGVLAITPDRYYCFDQIAAFRLQQLAHFAKDSRVYTLDQFDLKYNRPDIIVSRLGGDAEYARLLNLAWHKRLRNAGVSENQLSDDFHVPEISIVNLNDIASTTNADTVTLEVEVSDSREKPERLFLWVNNVPQLGFNGMKLNGSGRISLPVKLASGANNISVAVMNDKGARSSMADVTVSRLGKQPSKLWVVAMGVSAYDDKRFALNYAAKDATDIARLAAKSTNAFDKVETMTVTDKQFDANALTKVSQFLARAGRDDAVILFYAGHGVLDSRLDYYLAPHDMDFANPSARGITMERFTGVLENIAPLKRYVIIDACHSGGIDKELYLADNSTTATTPGAITFRSVGNLQQRSAEARTVSNLAADVFTSFNSDAGATVISSAAGSEVAVESDSWQNGLFTHLLKEGLGEHRDEATQNNVVTIESLVKYATARAAEISDNKQNPQIKPVNSTVLTLYK